MFRIVRDFRQLPFALQNASGEPQIELPILIASARDFVRACQTPILVLPDDVPAHPYAVAMEVVNLAPKAEVSHYPWKESKEQISQAVRLVRSFLRAHQPVTASR